MKYPKINTIWKRDEKTGKIIEGDFSKPEFAIINQWLITEKIDGTNIRVSFSATMKDGKKTGVIQFDGRTYEAQIPAHLVAALQKTFTVQLFEEVFSEKGLPDYIILFGEGYGAKIQKGGGLYRDDVGFILFDVFVETEGKGWWLDRNNVEEIAGKFDIPVVPVEAIGTWQDAVKLVKNTTASAVSKYPKVAEGVVCRSYPLLLFRNGDPVMFKLKVRDFD